ncbi:MAG: LysR family transcriptional regulator [Spongiibacteraceae bacterium]
MDLRKLKHALELSEMGNYARACQKLFITQSALSRSIQALEQELGVVLFERQSNGVRPTVAGEEVLAGARDLLRQANSLERNIALMRNVELGKLHFGVGPVPGYVLLPRILSVTAKERPRLKVFAQVQSAAKLVDLLLAEQIEFLIADSGQIAGYRGLDVQALCQHYGGLFVRRDHPLAGRRKIKLADLAEFPLASPAVEGVDVNQLIRNKYGDSAQWLGHFVCEDIAALKIIALESDAVLMLSELALQSECQTGTFVRINLIDIDQDWSITLAVAFLSGRTSSPIAVEFVQQMKRMLMEVGGTAIE